MEDVDDEMEDVEVDDVGDEFRCGNFDDDDLAASEEFDYSNNKIADTTAEQARKGKGIQGIPWVMLSISREKYRQTRLQQYKNYENVPNSGESSEMVCKVIQKEEHFYDFWRNSRSIKSTILHFQLRNLVWATSKHDGVLDLLEGFTQTQVSTFAVKDDFLVAGGFQGELICKHLDRPGVSFCSRTTYDDNAITNAIEIYNKPSGALHFTASNNDSGVRDFDMERYQLVNHFSFSLASQCKVLAFFHGFDFDLAYH
ncbi:unnamed protein product [Brassica napus]|uniref:(rape) hypothetical protein n=1 Tax=Brassica napus TaxID=3708 RepID=A0A816RT48_BRANA|nr:unnamed protein product [Brassica napus]